MGVVEFLLSLVVVPAVAVMLLRRGIGQPFWVCLVTLGLLPAIWATLIGARATPCGESGCVTASEADRLLIAAPGLLLLIATLVLNAQGRRLATAIAAVAGLVLTAFAVGKTDKVGMVFLALLAIGGAWYAVFTLSEKPIDEPAPAGAAAS